MKKYRLWDYYEENGLVGEYDTKFPLQRVLRLLHSEKGYEVMI